MLTVKTAIAPSPIHGTGLFSAQPIKCGTLVWRFTPGFDRSFTEAEILDLPRDAQIFLAKYAYKSRTTGKYVLPTDNGKYFNHSSEPNTESVYRDGRSEVVTYAIRDIAPGEELTDNYSSFEDEDDPTNLLSTIIRQFALTDEEDPRTKADLTQAA